MMTKKNMNFIYPHSYSLVPYLIRLCFCVYLADLYVHDVLSLLFFFIRIWHIIFFRFPSFIIAFLHLFVFHTEWKRDYLNLCWLAERLELFPSKNYLYPFYFTFSSTFFTPQVPAHRIWFHFVCCWISIDILHAFCIFPFNLRRVLLSVLLLKLFFYVIDIRTILPRGTVAINIVGILVVDNDVI